MLDDGYAIALYKPSPKLVDLGWGFGGAELGGVGVVRQHRSKIYSVQETICSIAVL